MLKCQIQTKTKNHSQGDHSPHNVKFPDISPTAHGTPPWYSAC